MTPTVPAVDQLELLRSISTAQARHIGQGNTRELFDSLLDDLLRLTHSEYGFIGEIHEDAGARYLKTWAITNIAWSDETRAFYEAHAPDGLEFRNLDTLFGAVIRTGRPLLTNTPKAHAAAGGTPDGHPALNAFLGLPFYSGDRFVGMVGIANRPDGYDELVVERLQPFLATCALIIEENRSTRERKLAQAALAESEAALRAIHSSVVEAILTVSGDGRVESANPAACSMFGVTDADLRDRRIEGLFPHSASLLGAGADGDVLELETPASRPDGTSFPSEVTLAPLVDDDHGRRVVVVRDVTHRHEVELAKHQFISCVSHELRTPLTSLQGSLQFIERATASGQPADATLVSMASRNAARLAALVNELLDMERIAAGKLEITRERTASADIVRGAMDSVGAVAAMAGLELRQEAEQDVAILADARRLEQVLINLVNNAVKYAGSGERVTVRTSHLPDALRFEVIDHGPGMSSEEFTHALDWFTQLDASDRRAQGGTGLGMAITRSLLELHDSCLNLRETPGGGCTFWFDIAAA